MKLKFHIILKLNSYRGLILFAFPYLPPELRFENLMEVLEVYADLPFISV
jgi:hypothetical protein